MAKLTDAQKRFLDEPFVGVVSTIRDDGSPHSTVVWVDEDDGYVEFNTARGRAKPRYLERDPRATLTVVDPQNPYRWLSVTGHAELVDEGADAQVVEEPERALEARRVHRGLKAEVRVVGHAQRLVVVADGEDRDDRPERLLAVDQRVRADAAAMPGAISSTEINVGTFHGV